MSLSLWKVERELRRFGQQLRAIPEALWEPFAQRAHDAQFAAGFDCRDGVIVAKDKYAIVLIFQPNGLAQSTVDMCAYLVQNGYAVLAICNAPLSEMDFKRLAPVIWRSVDRPNFGYDFGGYRDAIRALIQWDVTPKTLIILNDSIWFPLTPDSDLLARMEASEAGIVGANLRVRGEARFLESYLYRVKGEVFESPAYRAFWDGLRLTSNKYKVIRRGERGHSAAMLAAGTTLEGMFPPETFKKRIAEQDDDFLFKTLAYSALVEARWAQRAQVLCNHRNAAGWRQDVLAFVEEVMQKGLAYSSFPYASQKLQAYPILKKSGDQVSKLWRGACLKAIDAGDLRAPQASILSELRAKVAQDG